MNKLFLLLLAVNISMGIGCKNRDTSALSLKTFSEEEIKIILANAIKIEPINKITTKTIWLNAHDSTAPPQKLSINSQSFNVYIETDDKGRIIHQSGNTAKKASLIDPTRTPPIVITPNCSGLCSPQCTKTGCSPENGNCSTINCAGVQCNLICSNYSIAVGWSSYVIQ